MFDDENLLNFDNDSANDENSVEDGVVIPLSDEEMLSVQEEKTAKKEEANSISSDLIRGHINTIILRALYERDKYGYEIINDIESKSHGQYTLKQPTLYSALKRLENQGYIKAYWKTDEVTSGGRRKYFTLTDAGKEVTETNLAEWEYSRTIIDSLISDRSFDFNRPAPTPIDFTILRNSVSRVPVVHNEDATKTTEKQTDTSAQGEQAKNTEADSVNKETVVLESVTTLNVNQNEQTVQQYIQQLEQQQPAQQLIQQPEQQQPVQQPVQQTEQQQVVEQTVQQSEQQQVTQQAVQQSEQQVAQQTAQQDTKAEEEARRRVHENYLKLISEPVKNDAKSAEDIVPNSDKYDADKLIYNNRPETERDYKNLVDAIYYRTLNNNAPPPVNQQPTYSKPKRNSQPKASVNIIEQARADGVTVTPASETNSVRATRTTYNKSAALLKSSAVILAITILEFILCAVYLSELKVNWIYPSVIAGIGVVQFAVFLILCLNGYGKHAVRPTGKGYIGSCAIITVICILIISVASFLLNMNPSSLSEVMTMLVIPSITSLNIFFFSILFKLFIK